MEIERIEIRLKPGEGETHATEIVFENGQWRANGPIYSRISGALHEIWKLLRGGRH